ncbi:MAG TPA: SPOR domain-containing protein [Paludibacteraceae bacterium]|jgi:cell division protein FtsN|nr:SPOR domain-containing protein [Paludibacteraceae bacterium]MBP9017313.1 SPOR domain-containing protein [Paludibacteraceae bacterium]MDS1031187.1 SPOR domain-containing protein [Porphyromonadaceae sp. NP-X]HNZ61903.1 SPOR domain-containing protein [Paludibacteraceae bacterium]HOH55034.1 SPOR domain-containing protein [Paludibacteraceae bacterium]
MKSKKIIQVLFLSSLLIVALPACKSKQKIAEIPGANTKAATSSTDQAKTTAPVIVTQPSDSQTSASSTTNVPEITRKESFSLADGETNQAAMNYRYHVVVGSFKNQSNAKGLQRTLNSEGNNAVIVVNEQGMYRVLINSYNDYNQAHARINELQDRFPDAWVLIQK